MAKALVVVLSAALLLKAMALTCPASTATSCLFGDQGPAALMLSAPISTPVPAGTVCVRYTVDCLILQLWNSSGITPTTCPPGEPYTFYSMSYTCSADLPALVAKSRRAQNVILCGSTDCNAKLAYPPPSWTPLQSPCPSSGSATSCYYGGSLLDVMAKRTSPSTIILASMASAGLCMTASVPCSTAVLQYALDPSKCPAGQVLTQYMMLKVSDCLGQFLAFDDFAVCGTSNCNSPPTSTTVAGASMQSSVPAQQCPSVSTATTCISGLQLPTGAVVYDGPPPPASTPTGPSAICVRVTQDCSILSLKNDLNITNCPPGLPVTYYAAAPDCATALQIQDMFSVTAFPAQNVVVCGATDCNKLLAYPPLLWTPFQNPCPSTGSATSCYVGATGPAAVLATMSPPGQQPVAKPTSGDQNVCATFSTPCSTAIASGVDPLTCPAGQVVTQYVATSASSCLKFIVSLPNPTACGTSNCNSMPTTTSAAPTTPGVSFGGGTTILPCPADNGAAAASTFSSCVDAASPGVVAASTNMTKLCSCYSVWWQTAGNCAGSSSNPAVARYSTQCAASSLTKTSLAPPAAVPGLATLLACLTLATP